MTVRVLEGHVLDALRSLPSNTFQCVATSPPYYGLRDYGLPPQVWGGEQHEHEWGPVMGYTGTGRVDQGRPMTAANAVNWSRSEPKMERSSQGTFCACGAWLGSLGLEPTPELYVEHLVSVFREVRRTLRPDGVAWVNLGDSYAGSGKGPTIQNSEADQQFTGATVPRDGHVSGFRNSTRYAKSGFGCAVPGCKPKDLLGMPWMVAFALRADGWYLRAEIIWSKPNPMPESVADRPTKAHETVFLLSKSRAYFYDADAIREEAIYGLSEDRRDDGNPLSHKALGELGGFRGGSRRNTGEGGRNKRSVWEIATAPFPNAHFATWPPKLVEPMLLAGTSEKGCCPECGAPWERVVERVPNPSKPFNIGEDLSNGAFTGRTANPQTSKGLHRNGGNAEGPPAKTTGWRATCPHNAAPVPCQVLDPFGGAGTTALVADRLGRDCTLIELNAEYAQMARERIEQDAPLFAGVPIEIRPRADKAAGTPRNDGARWNQNKGGGFLPREVVG